MTNSQKRSDTAGWQPIETAPKTTLSRLVWCPERKNIYIVSWLRNHHGADLGWHHFGGGGSLLREEPSHWMPLPEPPGESA